MVVTSAQLENAIRTKIQNVSALIVSDVSGGCGQAYDVVIVSDVFEGMNTLKRHRMVNELLKDEIAQLHAFSQQTLTPADYATRSQSKDSQSKSAPAPPLAGSPAPTSSVGTAASAASAAAVVGSSSIAPAKPQAPQHGRTPSAISIPELTLTTEGVDVGSGGGGAAGIGSGQLTPSSSVSVVGETPAPLPQSPRISRLHLSKLQSAEFWLSLREFLENQFGAGAAGSTNSPSLDPFASATTAGGASTGTGAGTASPSRGHSPSNSLSLARAPGESEAAQVWEAFFLSAKEHLSASEIARVRDTVGYTAQGGV